MRRSTLVLPCLMYLACGDSPAVDDVHAEEADTSSDVAQSDVGADAATSDTLADVPDPTDAGDAVSPDGSGEPYVFERWVADETVPDVLVDRLCDEAADPEAAPDKINITCRHEGSNDLPAPAGDAAAITVMTWNLERGVHLDEMLAFFEAGTIPTPDILLASEVDRGCSRSGSIDVARTLADTLGYNYVFGVEFTELPRDGGSGGTIRQTCEHGNAVFSRYPLGNVETRFHGSNRSWYLPPDERESGEPRLGGRSFVRADVDLGGGQHVRTFAIHFESDPRDIEYQLAQAEEVATLGAGSPIPAIVGGDTNNVAYFIDVANNRDDVPDRVIDRTVRVFLDRGFVDPHRFIGSPERATRSGFVIDLLFGTSDSWTNAAVCAPEVCTSAISDHQAVWADYVIAR